MSEACAKLELARGTLPCGVRGCNAVEEPCSSGVQREPGTQAMAVGPRPVTSTKVQDATAAHTRRRPARPCATNSVQEEVLQQYVKKQGDTPLCNVTRVEKGTVTLDEDQGEVPTVAED